MVDSFYTNRADKKVNVTGLAGKPLQRVQGLADKGNMLRARNVALRQRMKIPRVGATAPAQVPQQPAPGTSQTLFPNARMFEPQNYEGSPLYKFQVQEGQKQLGKSLAARGLSNSGYGIEQELNIPLRAAAQDTERMTAVAMDNANRLQTMQENESNRLENQSNNQWKRMYDAASLMSAQSPWADAMGAVNSSASLGENQANTQANFLRDYYQRVFAPPPVTPAVNAPAPVQPDNSGSQFADSMASASRNQDILDFISSLLKSKPAEAPAK